MNVKLSYSLVLGIIAVVFFAVAAIVMDSHSLDDPAFLTVLGLLFFSAAHLIPAP